MEYYVDFPTSDATEMNKWLYRPASGVSYGIYVPNHRTYCSKNGTGLAYLYGPKRAVSDGGLVTFEVYISGADEANSEMYQTSDAYAKVHYFLQIGNTKRGVSIWFNNSRDYIYANYYDGNTQNPDYAKATNTCLIVITYNSGTGEVTVVAGGTNMPTTNVGAGHDCQICVSGYARDRYGCAIYASYYKFTAGILSDIQYAGDMNLVHDVPKFKSPYDFLSGNGGDFDIVYNPELTDLIHIPENYTLRYTQTDSWWTGRQYTIHNIDPPSAGGNTAVTMDLYGHWSGQFRFFASQYNMQTRDFSVYLEALNRTTNRVETWRLRHYYSSTSGNMYYIIIYEPDGTTHTYSHDWSMIRDSNSRIVIDIDEDTTTLTFYVLSHDYTRQISSPNFTAEFYRFTKIEQNGTSQLTVGGYSWFFRGYPSVEDLKDSIVVMPAFDSVLECTGQQWTEKVFNVFRHAIYNPLVPDDPATLKGIKLTNVDGLESIMALDSVCVVLDMYKRVYVYMLKEDPGVAESVPEIVHAIRSTTGHYWELIDIKTAGDESRIYSEQCAVEVSEATPGVCDYDSAADMSKTMVQLVHEGVVNPLYLRAFKVPGQHQIRIETSEPISAYKVIVNIFLAT